MNRRGFLSLFGKAAVGAAVVYSFPSIIVPNNISEINKINEISRREIYPKLIEDIWFTESPFFSYLRGQQAIFDEIDKDMDDALKTMTEQLDKQMWDNPTNEALFKKLGVPEFNVPSRRNI